jgi:hypothetical protein
MVQKPTSVHPADTTQYMEKLPGTTQELLQGGYEDAGGEGDIPTAMAKIIEALILPDIVAYLKQGIPGIADSHERLQQRMASSGETRNMAKLIETHSELHPIDSSILPATKTTELARSMQQIIGRANNLLEASSEVRGALYQCNQQHLLGSDLARATAAYSLEGLYYGTIEETLKARPEGEAIAKAIRVAALNEVTKITTIDMLLKLATKVHLSGDGNLRPLKQQPRSTMAATTTCPTGETLTLPIHIRNVTVLVQRTNHSGSMAYGEIDISGYMLSVQAKAEQVTPAAGKREAKGGSMMGNATFSRTHGLYKLDDSATVAVIVAPVSTRSQHRTPTTTSPAATQQQQQQPAASSTALSPATAATPSTRPAPATTRTDDEEIELKMAPHTAVLATLTIAQKGKQPEELQGVCDSGCQYRGLVIASKHQGLIDNASPAHTILKSPTGIKLETGLEGTVRIYIDQATLRVPAISMPMGEVAFYLGHPTALAMASIIGSKDGAVSYTHNSVAIGGFMLPSRELPATFSALLSIHTPRGEDYSPQPALLCAPMQVDQPIDTTTTRVSTPAGKGPAGKPKGRPDTGGFVDFTDIAKHAECNSGISPNNGTGAYYDTQSRTVRYGPDDADEPEGTPDGGWSDATKNAIFARAGVPPINEIPIAGQAKYRPLSFALEPGTQHHVLQTNYGPEKNTQIHAILEAMTTRGRRR